MWLLKWMRWTIVLCVIGLSSGCATVGDYCTVAQRPFAWHSDAEIDATPIRPLRYIEADAAIYARLCD